MATIRELIERIETRLFMLSGLDVQTHAEGQIEEMIRGVYNTLFDDFWHPDYTYHMTKTLDGAAGKITTDISSLVLNYRDIQAVFHDTDQEPLPRITSGTSIDQIRRKSIMPSTDATKVFKIVPIDTTGDVHIWYRTKIADSVWTDQEYDTVIKFDDDAIMFGVIYEFLVMDGSNREAVQLYAGKFEQRKKMMQKAQWNSPLSKTDQARDNVPQRWR